MEVDNYVLEIALERIKDYGEDFLIFINRDPNLLMLDHGEEFMEILHRHFQPEEMHRIVLELSDTISPENLDPLQHVLAYFKTYGIKIALDHLGQDTQLDRIAQISPNILKVNLDQLRISGGDAYQVILFSLSMLARKIGANLLFENIESEYQLRFAWKNGDDIIKGISWRNRKANSLIKIYFVKNSIKNASPSFLQRPRSLKPFIKRLCNSTRICKTS